MHEEVRGKRVLLVAPQPFYEDRGTPIAVLQVLEALAELGHRVDVVTFPVGRPVDLPGVRLFRARNPLGIREVPIGFSARKLALDAGLVAELVSRLQSQRYDAIHAVEEAAFPAVVLGRMYGVPVIYDMQSSLPQQLAKNAAFRIAPVQQLFRACERWLLRRADVVISSAGLAKLVGTVAPEVPVREWSFPSQRASAVRPDRDEARRELGIPPTTPTIVYTGTFEAYQGIDHLLSAIPLVTADVPGALFVLVGADSAAEPSIRRRAAELRLNGSLRIVARQLRERVPLYLAAADVLVSPRKFGNNLPLKIFDYLATGRPIVATDIPTHRSVLDDDRALLVAPTEQGLADGIIELLQNPARAAELGAAGRRYADRHHSWHSFVNSVGALYEEVTGRAARGTLVG